MQTEMTTERTGYGLVADAPDGAPAVWGARAIVSTWSENRTQQRRGLKARPVPVQRYGFDLVWDRQSWYGAESEQRVLREVLNGGALARAREEYDTRRGAWDIDPTKAKKVTLYEDDKLVIVADHRASHGYLYLGAWLKTPVVAAAPSVVEGA